MQRVTRAILFMLLVIGWPMTALASPVAEALFEEGRAAMKAQDWATACEKFAESNRIDPQPGTELNLATCSEKLGKLATAWSLYEGVVDALPADDDRRPIAEARIEALRNRVPKLTLNLAAGAPADTVVKIGETEVGGAGFGSALPVDPGKVVLRVSAPGHQPVELETTIEEGSHKTMEISPGPAVPATEPAPEPTPVPTPEPTPDAGGGTQAVVGWAIFGVGVAAVLAGVGTGIGGLVRKSDGESMCDFNAMTCSPEGAAANDEARVLLTTTTVTWIAGAVLAGVGLTVALTAGPDESAMLRVGPRGAALVVRF